MDKNFYNDVRNLANIISFENTKKLLVDLAINFSTKTKIQAVPCGTTVWTVEQFDQFSSYPAKTIHILLMPFFGMFVGYNSEVDILVLWENEKLAKNALEIINILLDHLPDSVHSDDESWDWCWNELSGNAQEEVKQVREAALNFLKGEK